MGRVCRGLSFLTLNNKNLLYSLPLSLQGEGLFLWVLKSICFLSMTLSRRFFRPAERVTFARCLIQKSTKVTKRPLHWAFTQTSHHFAKAEFSKTVYIVRHELFTRWEIGRQTLTLKPHKVAQLRRVELTSLVYLAVYLIVATSSLLSARLTSPTAGIFMDSRNIFLSFFHFHICIVNFYPFLKPSVFFNNNGEPICVPQILDKKAQIS